MSSLSRARGERQRLGASIGSSAAAADKGGASAASEIAAHERAAAASGPAAHAPPASATTAPVLDSAAPVGSRPGSVAGLPVAAPTTSTGPGADLDVTVLAFAQWASELKTRQNNSHSQLRAEMSMIRNGINTNCTDLSDFQRHGGVIQQQMQSEIYEIRESLGSIFIEITGAVRNFAAADQDLKMKVQSLNETAVRNETAFAQLADAADQSQAKLRSAVTEMQFASERMRDELTALSRTAESSEGSVNERSERLANDIDSLNQDVLVQLDRRREHQRKMVNDVVAIGESLQQVVADLENQRRAVTEAQGNIQTTLAAVDPNRTDLTQVGRHTTVQSYGHCGAVQGAPCRPVHVSGAVPPPYASSVVQPPPTMGSAAYVGVAGKPPVVRNFART